MHPHGYLEALDAAYSIRLMGGGTPVNFGTMWFSKTKKGKMLDTCEIKYLKEKRYESMSYPVHSTT
jgi:hypothetical protein